MKIRIDKQRADYNNKLAKDLIDKLNEYNHGIDEVLKKLEAMDIEKFKNISICDDEEATYYLAFLSEYGALIESVKSIADQIDKDGTSNYVLILFRALRESIAVDFVFEESK